MQAWELYREFKNVIHLAIDSYDRRTAEKYDHTRALTDTIDGLAKSVSDVAEAIRDTKGSDRIGF